MKYRLELQKLVGHSIPEAKLLKVASLVEILSNLQMNEHGIWHVPQSTNEVTDGAEFGSDLEFHAPARFLIDISSEEANDLVNETSTSWSHRDGWSDHSNHTNFQPSAIGGNFDLEWLQDACEKIVRGSASLLPRDELAMAICRILDSDKPGDEVDKHVDMLAVVKIAFSYGQLVTIMV